jgi:hypothetical protein
MAIDQHTGIWLEDFTDDPWQAHDLSQLVKTEGDWLKVDWPGVVERYVETKKAYENIRKRAGQTGIEAYLIRQNSLALGIGTVVFDQQITHPQEGSFMGSDVDYWIKEGRGRETHEATVEALIRKGGRKDLIATVVQDSLNPALGFDRHMRRIGEPAALSTDIPGDPFNVARGGKVSQLYYLPMP